jgi:hypothetical protein
MAATDGNRKFVLPLFQIICHFNFYRYIFYVSIHKYMSKNNKKIYLKKPKR